MNSAISRDALEFIDSLLTPKEIEESNARIAKIGEMIAQKLAETDSADSE